MRNSLLFIILSSLLFAQLQAKEYQIIWNPYCPYTCDSIAENGRNGIAIDIINEVFKDSEHTVTFTRIDSWLRAKRLIDKGVSDGMAFTFYNSGITEPGFITPDIPMLMVKGTAYISLTKNKIDPFHVADLARFKMIGSYRNSVNPNEKLAKLLTDNPNKAAYFTGADILERVSYMLSIGRLDIWLDSPDLLSYFIATRAGDKFSVSHAHVENKEYGGMLFNKSKVESNALAKMMSKGVTDLRKSGKMKKLLAVYGVVDNLN